MAAAGGAQVEQQVTAIGSKLPSAELNLIV
jgi:hypothetical protein